jgi:hypothetical protein
MTLLGQGAFVAWHGIAAGREVDYDRWHTHENMLERIGIPGFLRGRATSRLATVRATWSCTRSLTSTC